MVLTKEEIQLRMTGGLLDYLKHDSPGERLGLLTSLDSGIRTALPSMRSEGLMSSPGGFEDHLVGMPSEERLIIKYADEKNFESVGLNLRVSDEVYRSKVGLINRINGIAHLRQFAERGLIERVPVNGKITLDADPEANITYYVPSVEHIKLPSDLTLMLDARSNAGRIGLMCDDRTRDWHEAGNEGPVIVSIQPHAFPVELTPARSSVVQVVFRQRNSEYLTRDQVIGSEDIGLAMGEKPVDYGDRRRFCKEGMALTYHTDFVYGARHLSELPHAIRFDEKETHIWDKFFERIPGEDGMRMIGKRFYLTGVEETIRLGNAFAVITREAQESGTHVKGHFAGFIWPGFNGGITMENYCQSDWFLQRGDYAGFLRFDRVLGAATYAGGFQGQKAPRLPKMMTLIS